MADQIQSFISNYISNPEGATKLQAIFDDLHTSQHISEGFAVNFRQMCDMLPIGIVVHDEHRDVVYTNPSVEHILSLTPDQMAATTSRPKDWQIFYEDGSFLPPHDNPINTALLTGHAGDSITVNIIKPDGASVWALMTTSPVVISGKVKGVITSFNDVTMKREQNGRVASPQLEQEHSRMLSDFMRDASHELRTPLATIHTKLYLLMRKYEQLADSHDVMVINKHLDQLNSLVDKLELMTKLDERTRWTIMPVKLYPVLESVIDNYRYAYAGNIRLETDDKTYSVFGHEELIVIAFQQVIDNAIGFSPKGEDIHVHLWSEGHIVFVEITDQGIGMPEDVLNRVYERFYRQDIAHARRGFGLGLSIVARIMNIHSKELNITSELGKGTSVKMGFASIEIASHQK